jgi:hypothetical protein
MGMVRDWVADNWGLIVHTDKEQRDLKYKGNVRYDVEIDRQRSGALLQRPNIRGWFSIPIIEEDGN